MPSFRTRLTGIATLAILAGCGSSDGGPTYQSTADSAALTFFAVDAHDQALQELALLNDQFPLSGGLVAPMADGDRGRAGLEYLHRVLAAWARQGIAVPAVLLAPPSFSSPYSECHPVITGVDIEGVAIDTDDDGIPDDYKLDFGTNCVDSDSTGTQRIVQSGSFRLQDLDDGFFSWKLTLAHERIRVEDLTTGYSSSGGADGFETGRFADSGAHRVLALTVDQTTVSDGSTSADGHSLVRVSTFTPDSGEVLARGSTLPAGKIDYASDSRTINAFEGGNYYFYVRTATPLHFVPDCAHQFDAGTLRGVLNRNEATGFEYVWAGCAAPTRTIFGNTEPTATTAAR